jgi:ethanolamine utilization protein EutJ
LSRLNTCAEALKSNKAIAPWEKLYLGIDLGTTNIVVVALNEKGEPVAASMTSSSEIIRDGVVVDYWRAIKESEKNVETICSKLGISLDRLLECSVGASAYPPGISSRTAQVCANVVEALGMPCKGLYEEPVAAARALELENGVIVDIGGGTTGIAIFKDGEVVYSADEPTGGTHMTLVISGRMGISFEEAEEKKRDRSNHRFLRPILVPVVEKMATIVKEHLHRASWDFSGAPIYLVGGGADIEGSEEVFTSIVQYPVRLAEHCLLVTPMGIASMLWEEQCKEMVKEDAAHVS